MAEIADSRFAEFAVDLPVAGSVEMTIPVGHSVSGRVLLGDAPLAGHTVELNYRPGVPKGRILSSASTDAEGRYVIGNVPEGDFSVWVTVQDYGEQSRMITVRGKDLANTDIRIVVTGIQGRFVHVDGSIARISGRVTAVKDGVQNVWTDRVVSFDAGQFRISPLDVGHYTLRPLVEAGDELGEQSVEVNHGRVTRVTWELP